MMIRMDDAGLSKEDIDRLKEEVLEDNIGNLSLKLTPERFYPYLRQARVISGEDCEYISKQITNKGLAFMDVLLKKGPKAFDELCKALIRERTHVYLLAQLNKQFEEKRYQLLQEKRMQTHRHTDQHCSLTNIKLPPKIRRSKSSEQTSEEEEKLNSP